MTPFKRCRCCGTTYTTEQWRQLPYGGVLEAGDDSLELRDCRCRSTLAVSLRRMAEAATPLPYVWPEVRP